MKASILVLLSIILVAQAVNLKNNHKKAQNKQGDSDDLNAPGVVQFTHGGYGNIAESDAADQDVQDYDVNGKDGCCGPLGSVVDSCEASLLRNYQSIEIDRLTTIVSNSTNNINAQIEVTVEIPDSITVEAWSAEPDCRTNFITTLRILSATAEEFLELTDSAVSDDIHIVSTSNNLVELQIPIGRVPSLGHNTEVIDDVTYDVLTFELTIYNLRNDILRKHVFRTFISLSHNFADTTEMVAEVPRTRFWRTDSDCVSNPNFDGECRVAVWLELDLICYKDENFSVLFVHDGPNPDHLMIGDPVYCEIFIQDSLIERYVHLQQVWFNPECCELDVDAEGEVNYEAQVDYMGTAAFWVLSSELRNTTFKFLTYKSFTNANLTVVGSVEAGPMTLNLPSF